MILFRSLGFGGILWIVAVFFSSSMVFGEISKSLTWDRVDIHVTDAGDPDAKRNAVLTLAWQQSDGTQAQFEATRRALGGDFRHVAQGETLSALSNPAQFGDLKTPMLFGVLYLYLGILLFGLWRLIPFGATSILGRTEMDPFDPNGLTKLERKRGLAQLSLKLVILGLYGIGFSVLGDNHRAEKAATYLPAQARVVSVDRKCQLEWTTGIFPFRDTEKSKPIDCGIAHAQAAQSDASVIPDHTYILGYTHPEQGAQTKKVFQLFMREEEPSEGESVRVMMHPHRGQSIDNYERVNGGRSWGFMLGCAVWSVIFALIAYLSWPGGPAPAPKRSNNRLTRRINRPKRPQSRQQPHPW